MTQKEQFTLLGDDGRPSTFAPLLLSCLSLANSLELESIKLGFKQEESMQRSVESRWEERLAPSRVSSSST